MEDGTAAPVGKLEIQKNTVDTYCTKFRGRTGARTGESARTCTARQLLQASQTTKQGGRFVIDNRELYTVFICGRILSIDQNENQTDYKIDDGTGVIAGRIWPTNNTGLTGLSGGTLGDYYRIVANVVTYQGGLLLQTKKAEPVKDHNAITLHFLTAIHEHCDSSRLTKHDVQRWKRADEEAKKISNGPLKLELDKEAVVSFLCSELIRSSEHGASSDNIMTALQMDFQEAWTTLNAMIAEGSVYNTVDYKHFKLADEN